ncbi:MAG: 3-deoxy-8-phosphooctulonate synthase [Deltaproteobacteria bacterium]|nr:3-deoxy-8-phosphooctulonate synthase [Deltaproteobacteria bacterium]
MKQEQIRTFSINDINIGGTAKPVLIAGPCVIESYEATRVLAEQLQDIAARVGMQLVFKASYDKANRTSADSYRGPGLQEGLSVLQRIRRELSVPVVSDVHRHEEILPAAEVLDMLQVPAFLCRQTDFIIDIARAGKPVNIKKGQFMAPEAMRMVFAKAAGTGNHKLMVTERGVSFGYNNLVADMRSLVIMRQYGYPVVFDATHSVQLPGAQGVASGGDRRFVAPLARAAAAVGIDALFLEVHADPDRALCDGPNSLRLSDLELLLQQVLHVAAGPFAESL